MDVFQFHVLQDVLVICALAFALMLPLYAAVRQYFPEYGWNHHGNVSTAAVHWFDLLGVVAIASVMSSGFLVSEPAVGTGKGSLTELSAAKLLVLGSANLILAAGVMLTFAGRVHFGEFFGLRTAPWKVLASAVLGVIGMYILTVLVMNAGADDWLKTAFGEKQEQDVVTRIREETDQTKLLAMAILACVYAPIAEELIFRAYIYRILKRFSDRFFAAVLSGVLFGLIHGSVWAMIPLTLFGIILALVYELSGTIWAPIATHALFNTITVLCIIYQL